MIEAPTTATDRASSMRWIGVRPSPGREGSSATRYFFPSALSFFAMRKACQPGMPFTPPPACVAEDPW